MIALKPDLIKPFPAGMSLEDHLNGRSFACLEQDGVVTLCIGHMHHLQDLAQIDVLADKTDRPVAFALPYRTIRERGFEAQGDEPILALEASEVYQAPMSVFRAQLPEVPITLAEDIQASMSDAAYAELVAEFQEQEIEGGHCAQAILSRSFNGRLQNYSLQQALSLYRTILFPQGQYMTVLFCNRSGSGAAPQCLIGATPERHLTVTGEHVLMNPIAGTLRKEDQETFAARLNHFVSDPKEINELFQVVDEELKMMGRICPDGGTITGPALREIGSVVHTEYELAGTRGLEPIEALRLTLHAPTVVGGPMESAARIIAKYETTSRRYYAGEVGLCVPPLATVSGVSELDCAIAIRCAEIDPDGYFRIQAGGGLVRDSDPLNEARESRAKAMGMMAFLMGEPQATARYLTADLTDQVTPALTARNDHLSSFWMQSQADLWQSGLSGSGGTGSVLILNNEDDFAYMIAHVCRGLGYDAEVIDTFDVVPSEIAADIVILGPGPGDPNDQAHPRMVRLKEIIAALSAAQQPMLGVCLGHQAIAATMGLPVERQSGATQGMQREVTLFGGPHRLAFYNSFAVTAEDGHTHSPDITYEADEAGRMTTFRQGHVLGIQFHPESIMSETGPQVLQQLLESLRLAKDQAA